MPGNGHHGRQDEAAGTAWQSHPPRPRRRRGQPDDPATTTDERQHLRNATQLLPKLPQEDSCSRKGTGSAKKTVEVRAQFVRPLGPSVQLMHSTGPTHDNSEQSSIMGSPLNTAHVLRFLVEGHAHTSTDCCRWFTRRRWILLHGTSRGPEQPGLEPQQ